MPFARRELTQAFEADEFFPAFQPVVELRTGKVAGFEVLARWEHRRHGLVVPDAFIPAVERHGYIHRLTEVMLRKAFSCKALADSDCGLSVNVSPTQLCDSQLPNTIARAAEQAGFPLQRLVIELTESALMADLSQPMRVAGELKALGCRLSLDDFGTGYSSLRHLHALPFDVIKVDRSFVISMLRERGSRKIVASVIGLGQSLGLQTIAEGVETPEHAELLFGMACDFGQGWLYGKPVHADEIPRILAESSANFTAVPVTPLSGDSLGPEGPPMHRLAQLQAIYDGAPVGLALLDRKLRYVSLNRHLALFNNMPTQAHLGRTPAEIVPLVFAQVESSMRSALGGEPCRGIEIHKKLPNGDAQILLGSYEPVRDEAGEVIGVSVAVMDVTEHKRMEAVLRAVEDHYRNMVDVGPHVPWVLNSRGELIDAGSRWETITGQSMTEAMGDGWLGVLHPDDVPPTVQAIRASMAKGSAIDLCYRVRRRDGEWKWMRSRGVPRFDPQGNLMAIYGAVEELPEDQPLPVRLSKS